MLGHIPAPLLQRGPAHARAVLTIQPDCFPVPIVCISRPDQQATGASMWISQVTRIPPQSVDPSVKDYHWPDMVVAQLDAYDHQCPARRAP